MISKYKVYVHAAMAAMFFILIAAMFGIAASNVHADEPPEKMIVNVQNPVPYDLMSQGRIVVWSFDPMGEFGLGIILKQWDVDPTVWYVDEILTECGIRPDNCNPRPLDEWGMAIVTEEEMQMAEALSECAMAAMSNGHIQACDEIQIVTYSSDNVGLDDFIRYMREAAAMATGMHRATMPFIVR